MLTWIKSHIVDDWRSCWKWFSMHVAVVMGAIGGLQEALSNYGQSLLPPDKFALLMIVLALLLVFGRLVKQTQKAPDSSQ